VLAYRAVSLCLVAALAGLPLAPVEHVHRTEGSDGRHQVVAHAHLEDHHHAEPGDDHLATHVEDDDTVVLTIDRIFIPEPPVPHLEMTTAAAVYVPPLAVVRAARLTATCSVSFTGLREAPPHFAPRLRLPPSDHAIHPDRRASTRLFGRES